MTIEVRFNDSGRTATQPANPEHPNGMDIVLAETVIQKTCSRNLPYPAPRCGTYSIVCRECGFTALVTVAGRADDPRSITMSYKVKIH